MNLLYLILFAFFTALLFERVFNFPIAVVYLTGYFTSFGIIEYLKECEQKQ